MSFFRSVAARRILYALMIALALVRFAKRVHSEPFFEDVPGSAAAIVQPID